jgi:hypothetical protein
MKRLLDLVLMVAILGAAGYGAYLIGKRVDHYSSQQAEEVAGTTTIGTTTRVITVHKKSNKTPYFVVGGVGIGAGVIMLSSLFSSMTKSRRRERWRAG